MKGITEKTWQRQNTPFPYVLNKYIKHEYWSKWISYLQL